MRLLTDAECERIAQICFNNVFDVEDLYWILPEQFNMCPEGEDAEVIAEMLGAKWDDYCGEKEEEE